MTNHEVYAFKNPSWGDVNKGNGELIQAESYLLSKYMNKDWRILEAGCGGGRICSYLAEHGYEHMEGFDFVEDFIANAKSRGNSVRFFVADASDLSGIDDNQYDGLIYLAQVISFVPRDKIHSAIAESYRICRGGGGQSSLS